jgi:hypothetical protein
LRLSPAPRRAAFHAAVGIAALTGSAGAVVAEPTHELQQTQQTQPPQDEQIFDPRRFRDSLSHIVERRTIRDIEQKYSRTKSAVGAVAAGFAALRSWELSHLSSDAKNARRHFENARVLDQLDPWALYGWALASLPQVKAPDDAGRFGFAGDNMIMTELGLDPASRARRALEKAVDLDPSMTEAAQLLAHLAVQTHDDDALGKATTTLQSIADRSPDDAATRLALAKAANATGDLETAAAAAKAAAALATGAEAATAHHQAARALLRVHGRENEGAAEYFAGLHSASRSEILTYFDELREIATAGELAQLTRLPVANAESWIRTFWDLHAAMSAVSVPQRLAAHFQRLAHVEEFYRRKQQFGAPALNALLFDRPESPFDDRGMVYMRHGKPDDVITTRKSQSWVYRNEGDKPLMFHFTDGGAEQGLTDAARQRGSLAVSGFRDWYLMYNLPCEYDFMESRAVYDNRIASLVHHCDIMTARDVSARVRRDVYEGLKTDIDPSGFTLPLAASFDIYTFKGADRQTDIVAALAVQAARMQSQTLTNGEKRYSVKASVIVFDTATRTVFRKDSSFEAQSIDAATRGSLVLGNLQFPATPAPGMVHRVSVADAYVPARGHLYGGPLKVPDYSGDTLMISDIVLAAPDSVGTFKRGDVSLTLVPWQVFPRGDFRLFYELYNVSPGNTYTTELIVQSTARSTLGAIRSLFGNRPLISLRFDDVAPVNTTLIQQVRSARADLEPGEYKLTVRITDKRTGQKIERTRPVTIAN